MTAWWYIKDRDAQRSPSHLKLLRRLVDRCIRQEWLENIHFAKDAFNAKHADHRVLVWALAIPRPLCRSRALVIGRPSDRRGVTWTWTRQAVPAENG